MTSKAENFLQEKLKTPVHIGGINFSLTKFLKITDVFIPDQQKDTILFSRNVYVGFSISKIFSKEIDLERIEFEGITSNIKISEKDSSFNFDYITKSFAAADTVKKIPVKAAPETKKDTAQSFALNIKNLKNIHFKDIKLAYLDEVSGIKTALSLGSFVVEMNGFDFLKSRYHIKKIGLENTYVALKISKLSQTVEKEDTSSSALPVMDIALGLFSLKNIQVAYNDEITKQNIKFKLGNLELIPNKLDLGKKNISLKSFLISDTYVEFAQNLIAKKIEPVKPATPAEDTTKTSKSIDWTFSLSEFAIRNFSARYDDYNYAILKDEIDPNHLYINYFNFGISEIEVLPNKMHAKITELNFRANHGLQLDKLSTELLMDSTHLWVQDFNLGLNAAQLSSTIILNYKDLAHIADANLDANIYKLSLNIPAIKKFLPANTIPDGYLIPDKIQLSGNFKGNAAKFNTILKINTTLGNVGVTAKCENITDMKRATYDLTCDLDNFQLGRFMKMDTTTALTISLAANGKGLELDKIKASTKIDIKKAFYNDYEYTDFVFKGDIDQKSFNGSGFMVDDNIEFDLKLIADLNNKLPIFDLKTNIQKLNLKKLKLYDDSLSFAGEIETRVKGASLDTISAFLKVNNFKIIKDKKTFNFESTLDLNSQNKSTYFTLVSNIFDAHLKGQIQLSEAAGIMGQFFNQYFSVNDTLKNTNFDYCNFDFGMEIKDISMIQGLFVPDLKELSMDKIVGSFSNRDKKFTMKGGFPKIIYGDFNVNNVTIDLKSDPKAINYAIGLDSVYTSSFCVPGVLLDGNIKNNSFLTHTIIFDRDKEKDIAINGTLTPVEKGLQFTLADTGFVFDHQVWTVPADNSIYFDSLGIKAFNVILQNADQRISFLTSKNKKGIPEATLRFDSFDVHNFSAAMMGIVPNENVVSVGGRLNGTINLIDPLKDMRFATDLKITEFIFVFQSLGDISVKVSNLDDVDKFDIDFGMAGQNDLSVTGSYINSNPQNPLDFKINVKSFDVFPIGFWVSEIIEDLQGKLDGEITLKGSPDFPKVNGYMHCNEVGFNIAMLQDKLKLVDEKVFFDAAGIHFRGFNITDEFNNKATIKGSLLTENFSVYNLNLRVLADNFTLMNSTEKDNKEYYGKLSVGTDLRITGTSNHPIIDAKLNINRGTDLTYVLTNNSSFQSTEGVVEFINTNKEKTAVVKPDSSSMFVMELGAKINLDKKAKFKTILDAYTGDEVEISAGADLVFTMAESGNMSLLGKAEVENGSYYMPQFKKKFLLEKGSYLSWVGDPYNPTLKIAAIYPVKTSPLNLMSEELASSSAEERKAYNKKLPFQVTLNLEGELVKSAMTFSISLPKSEQGAMNGTVNSKLQKMATDEAELNKQAISLMLIGGFIPSVSMGSSGGFNTTGYTYQLVSQQLNAFAEKKIKFLDLNFDLQAYDDNGKSSDAQLRTDLKVQVSKKFFDDRLEFLFGGVFLLQGTQQESSSKIAPTIVLVYKLTKDGRYSMRLFQENQYKGLLDGQILERGVSIMFTKDYNKFKEIFRKPEEIKIDEDI